MYSMYFKLRISSAPRCYFMHAVELAILITRSLPSTVESEHLVFSAVIYLSSMHSVCIII
jgi:hypothetical protein